SRKPGFPASQKRYASMSGRKMAAHGYRRPYAASGTPASITLLEKLSHWSGEAGRDIRPMSWLMTHPPIKDRIAHAQTVIEAGVPEAA
ncbi:MAG: hypothetical protein AAFV96_02250, partial [Pseudomonadota bacterium]